MHSTYSQFDGMTEIPALFERCEQLGMPGVALTDHGNTRGLQEFFKEASKHLSVKPIAGCEFYLTDHYDSRIKDADHRRCFHLILLAKNMTGYDNLQYLMLAGYKKGYYNHRPRISHELLLRHHEGLICTSACIGGEVAQAILSDDLEAAEKAIKWYKDLFGDDFYLEVDLHPNEVEKRIYPLQKTVAKWMFILGHKMKVKVIAANDVHFLSKEDAELHDRMLLAKTGASPDDPNRFRYTGEEYIKSYEEMEMMFLGHPEALENTIEVCNKVERYIYQMNEWSPDNESDSLDEYLTRVGNYPLLSSIEEKKLVRIAQSGDDDAFSLLYNSNLRFVVSIARGYLYKGLSTEAVILAGNEGLRRAIMKYDPNQEFRLMAYAVWWVRNSIMRALSNSKVDSK